MGESWATEGTTWGSTVPPTGWRPGMTSIAADVACCPKCGEVGSIHCKGLSAGLIYWTCQKCAGRWKTKPASSIRGRIVG
jgi:hypothetical protein